jgi:hypothetical protein
MTETSRIADQLHRAYAGPAWHGPALTAILADVTAAEASAHPVPGAHSIWELVLHITVWMWVADRRIAGEVIPDLPLDRNFPSPGEPSEAGWRNALDALAQIEQRLEAVIRALPDARLSDIVMGDEPQSIYILLHGIVQHNLYHGGQMAILKKAAR